MAEDKANTGNAAFFRALAFGELDDIKKTLDDGADPASASDAVLISVLRDRPELTAFLLDLGCPIHQGNDTYGSPLEAAICKSNPELALYLIARGAKAGNDDSCFSGALLLSRKKSDVVEALIVQGGLDVNAPLGKFGEPPLNLAVRYNDPASVALLLKLGASTGGTSLKTGQTALHYASSYGQKSQERIVEILMQAGADPLLTDNKGLTALDLARETNAQNKIRILEEATADYLDKKRWQRIEIRLDSLPGARRRSFRHG